MYFVKVDNSRKQTGLEIRSLYSQFDSTAKIEVWENHITANEDITLGDSKFT